MAAPLEALRERPCDGPPSTWTRAATIYGQLTITPVWVSTRDELDKSRPCTLVPIRGSILVLVHSTSGVEMSTLASQDIVLPRLAQVSGVRNARLAVGRPAGIFISLDGKKLGRYGLSRADVLTAIASANLAEPQRGMDGPHQNLVLGPHDDLAERFRGVHISEKNGGARLSDVAAIEQATEEVRSDPATNPKNAAVIALDVDREAETMPEVLELLRRLALEVGDSDMHVVEDLGELTSPPPTGSLP